MVCRLIGSLETPTHTIFLGKAEEAEILDGSQTPMTYSYYHRVIKGKAPKNAPTWQPEKQEAEEKSVSYAAEDERATQDGTAGSVGKWICGICGYAYEGETLPEDFKCPICGRGPEVFRKA